MGRGRPRYPDVLTPREWEVLTLLRAGLTNDDIAERLGISPRTAKYHVSEIIGKLGVTDRRMAAKWQQDVRATPAWAIAPVAWFARRLFKGSVGSPGVGAAGAGSIAAGCVLATAAAALGVLGFLVLHVDSRGPVRPPSAIARPAATQPIAKTIERGPSMIVPAQVLAADPVAAAVSSDPPEPTESTPEPPATPAATPTPTAACAVDGCETPPALEAPASLASLDFALAVDVNGDGINDCGTGAPLATGDGLPDLALPEVDNDSCVAPPDANVSVRIYLMDTGGIAYTGQSSRVYYYGLASSGIGGVHWPCPTFERTTSGPNWESVGSVISNDEPDDLCLSGQTRTEIGLLNEFTLKCSEGGALSLGHGTGQTSLIDADRTEHHENSVDALSITCGDRKALPPSSPQLSITQRALAPLANKETTQ